MKNRRTWQTIALIAAAAMLVSTVALARGPRGGGADFEGGPPCAGPDGDRGPGFRGMRALSRLDLGEDQDATLEALREQHMQQVKPLHEALDAKHEEMKALWQADLPDRDALLATQSELDSLRSALQVLKIDHRIAVLMSLTPEQRTELQTFMAERQGKRGKWGKRGKRGERGERGERGDRGPKER